MPDLVEVWEQVDGSEYIELLHRRPFNPQSDPADAYTSELGEVFRTVSSSEEKLPDGVTVCKVIMRRVPN